MRGQLSSEATATTPSPGVTLADLLAVPAGDAAAVSAGLERLLPGADARTARVLPLEHGPASPATAGLYRVGAPGPEGAWSLFCKVLRHPRHWPGLAAMPPWVATEFAAEFPWCSELELWDPAVQASLPEGLRSPVLHGVVDLGDDRLAVWQEDVATAAEAHHDLAWFERAARLLGRWNARSTTPDVLAVPRHPPGHGLRRYVVGAVAVRGLGPLGDDALWAHPWLAPHGGLRDRLRRLATRLPALLDRLDGFVQALPHGDASPQNLLVPAADPAGLVAIDLAFRCAAPLGSDLGQLVVGLVHAGELPAADLPELAEAVVAAYAEGLAAEGMAGVPPPEVREAFAIVALVRSGFDGFLYDLLGHGLPDDGPERHAFDERVRVADFLAGLATDASGVAGDSEPAGTRGTMAR